MNKLKNNAWFRKAGMALLDIVLIVLSVYLSMELRFEMYIPSRHMETMYAAMPMVVVVYMACYVLGGIYQIMWRYAGVRDVARLCLLSAIACGVTLALNQFLTLGLFLSLIHIYSSRKNLESALVFALFSKSMRFPLFDARGI